MIQALVKEARSYLGTQQGDARHQALINSYNAVKPIPVAYPLKEADDWCADFVTVVADRTNCSPFIGRECGVHRFAQIFRQKKIWLGLEKPKAGDIVVFDWRKNGWMDHIGIVEKFSGKQVTVIEGNSNKCVARRSYDWNDWRIAGYARPNYPKMNQSKEGLVSTKLIEEVLAGKWGNGQEREQKLKKAGYHPKEVQKEVNQRLAKKDRLKSNKSLAKEVLAGKWGNGPARKSALKKAGYDAEAIQKLVNQLIK